jgi:hypothetical protein
VTDTDFVSNLSKILADISNILNGKVSLSDNGDNAILSVTFASAGVELGVTHNLNRIPLGYILVSTPTPIQIYDGVSKNTIQSIYLRATVATTVTVLVF